MLQRHTTNHSKGKGKARTYSKADRRNQLLFLAVAAARSRLTGHETRAKNRKIIFFMSFWVIFNRFFKHEKPILPPYMLLYIAQKRAEQPGKVFKKVRKKVGYRKMLGF